MRRDEKTGEVGGKDIGKTQTLLNEIAFGQRVRNHRRENRQHGEGENENGEREIYDFGFWILDFAARGAELVNNKCDGKKNQKRRENKFAQRLREQKESEQKAVLERRFGGIENF
ncbi:MAG: hypothetical protein HDKAJFGB_04093 [Anaerolineae bacterium]|nr:hypothetical protein [Anaerolineae bacterium]